MRIQKLYVRKYRNFSVTCTTVFESFFQIFELVQILVQWMHQGILKLEKCLNSIIVLKAVRSLNRLSFRILARRGRKQEKRMQWCSKIITKPKIFNFPLDFKNLNSTHLLLDSKQILQLAPDWSWITTSHSLLGAHQYCLFVKLC